MQRGAASVQTARRANSTVDKDHSKILYGLLAVFSADKLSYFLSKITPLCAGLLQIIQLGVALATLTFILVKIAQAKQQIRYFKDEVQTSKKPRTKREKRK